MAKAVGDHEFVVVSVLRGPDRYSHFIGQVAEVWGLCGPDGWVVAADDDGRQLMPVWTHSRYAEACAVGAWNGAVPEAIALSRWLEAWLPGLTRDGRGVAVFPVPCGAGVPVDPGRLAADLCEALEQYE
jgi:hypothetical protein